MEEEPLRKKAAQDLTKAKLEAVERSLGISSDPSSSSTVGPSGSGKGKEPEEIVGKKRRFEDTKYLEQSETIVENVKSAVVAGAWIMTFQSISPSLTRDAPAGLLKKRKKAKLAASEAAPNPEASTTAELAVLSDAIVEPPAASVATAA